MTLAALICAYHESEEIGGPLRATLPLAGRTLIERQARIAANAGARPIIVAVERQPPELTAAIDRLRAEGLDMLIARTAGDAAKAVQSSDRLLLMADGLLADEDEVQRLVSFEGNALLTVPDLRFDEQFERIDADSRWGGLALIDGQTLKHTAAMLQDWDLQSTLLRRAVQGGARHLSLSGDPVATRLLVAERGADLADLESRILEHASAYQTDWVSRYLLAPLEHAAVRRLMPTGVTPTQLSLLGLVLSGLSAISFSRSWLWAGLVLFLLATPLAGMAERLGRLRFHGRQPDVWLSRLTPVAAAAALLALGYALTPLSGWGCMVLTVAAIAFLVALAGERAPRGTRAGAFLAEPKGMAWLMLPFAATGQWAAGLGALALYAAGSFFWGQRQVHGPKGLSPKD
ncbi:MAG TPA: hypothetical protein VGD10_10085 [Allosphingosinicella sp.]|uniref:hypothetical protein n=1 Tax=Allosphingosinicella sp. TaxID=2823234 RepID=UPI002ED7A1B6